MDCFSAEEEGKIFQHHHCCCHLPAGVFSCQSKWRPSSWIFLLSTKWRTETSGVSTKGCNANGKPVAKKQTHAGFASWRKASLYSTRIQCLLSPPLCSSLNTALNLPKVLFILLCFQCLFGRLCVSPGSSPWPSCLLTVRLELEVPTHYCQLKWNK